MTKFLALVAIASCFFAAVPTANSEQREGKTPYYSLFSSDWQSKFSSQSFQMISTHRPDAPEQPIVLRFNPELSHATLLAMVDGGQARMPALLHFPDQGSLRIEVESREPVLLQYEAHRRDKAYIEVFFPGATQSNPRVVYTFTVVAIYPHLKGIETDPRFATVEKISDSQVRFVREDLISEHRGVLPITLTPAVTLKNSKLTFDTTLENKSIWTVETVDYPFFGGLNGWFRRANEMKSEA